MSVVLAATGDDEGSSIAARLIDISAGGAKLALAACPGIGSTLMLRLDEVQVSLAAKVCWSRPESDGMNWIACAFEQALPTDALEQLIQLGYLERRQDFREPIEIPATVRWKLGESSTVALRDYSAGGLCFSSPHCAEIGQRILLLPQPEQDEPPNATADSVLAEVHWQIEFRDGYLIGCAFVHRQGLATLRRVVSAQSEEAAAVLETPLRSRNVLKRGFALLKSISSKLQAAKKTQPSEASR